MGGIPKADPTPSEIRQACLEIQKEWTEAERQKRLRADWRVYQPNSMPVTPVKVGLPSE